MILWITLTLSLYLKCICCKQHCDIVLYVRHTNRYFTCECTCFVTFTLCKFVCVYGCARARERVESKECLGCSSPLLHYKLVVKLTNRFIPLKWWATRNICIAFFGFRYVSYAFLMPFSCTLFYRIIARQAGLVFRACPCVLLFYLFLFSRWLKWCLCTIFSSINELGGIQFYFILSFWCFCVNDNGVLTEF
jgi:hypothetical protein